MSLKLFFTKTYVHYKVVLKSANYYGIQRANLFTKNAERVVTKGTSRNRFARFFDNLFVFLRRGLVTDLRANNTNTRTRVERARPSRTIQSRYENARRLIVENVLKGASNSLAADIRRRTVRQLFNGEASPFVDYSGLAASTTVAQPPLESLCFEIRESMCRMRNNLSEVESVNFDDDVSLESLEFGSVIAKGSNAVVYEAREKPKHDNKYLPKFSKTRDDYPFAVKMMFNYDAESNATSILRSMYREMVPLRHLGPTKEDLNFWELEMAKRIKRLPPHSNIVAMYRSFTDYIPNLPDSRQLYPDALPSRINPGGYGRNMSLFLIMKKYNVNLREYLRDTFPNPRDGVLLFAQLLEAVAFLVKNEIAHRDLKSDNILLDTSFGDDYCPLLVITDFGCCLSDRINGLQMPYKTPDLDRGGNAALMSPEVACASPGMFSSIDYTKSDLWTAGTIAYEIFQNRNPFYGNRDSKPSLRNTTYAEHMLPNLPEQVPATISKLVRAILTKNPNKRPDAELAATICQLYLWAPSHWLQHELYPSNTEILEWLLSLTTKVLYEGSIFFKNGSPNSDKSSSFAEYQLIATFLQRVKLHVVRKGINWIRESDAM